MTEREYEVTVGDLRATVRVTGRHVPARGPSYASGGEPAEDPECEVIDAGREGDFGYTEIDVGTLTDDEEQALCVAALEADEEAREERDDDADD